MAWGVPGIKTWSKTTLKGRNLKGKVPGGLKMFWGEGSEVSGKLWRWGNAGGRGASSRDGTGRGAGQEGPDRDPWGTSRQRRGNRAEREETAKLPLKPAEGERRGYWGRAAEGRRRGSSSTAPLPARPAHSEPPVTARSRRAKPARPPPLHSPTATGESPAAAPLAGWATRRDRAGSLWDREGTEPLPLPPGEFLPRLGCLEAAPPPLPWRL